MRPFQGGQVPAGGKDPAAKTFTAVEIAAGLRSVSVNGAEECGRIESDTGAVATLVHAARAGMLDDEMAGHHIPWPQLDHQMAATATTGTRRKIGMKVDASRGQHSRCLATFSWRGGAGGSGKRIIEKR